VTTPTDDTPSEAVAAHAVQEARRYAMLSWSGVQLVPLWAFRVLVAAVVVSVVSVAALWVYVLHKLPP